MIEAKDGKKRRATQRKIVIGVTYGNITALDKCSGNPPSYICRCEKCQSIFNATGQQILKYCANGCRECRKKARAEQLENNYKSYIGKIYGSLEVIGYSGLKIIPGKGMGHYPVPVMICKCKKCDGVTEIPLSRLKQGGAKQCASCAQKNLIAGREIGRELQAGGTSIMAIDGRRKINKNSSTGHTGICYMQKIGRYRAYITFRRKQYHLGVYNKIEDAIAARKQAEKNLYGDFLRWYAEAYPEKWEKIKKKEPGE